MSWCLLFLAVIMALMGLSALYVRPGQLRPDTALRGCLATICLVGAVGIGCMALAISGVQP